MFVDTQYTRIVLLYSLRVRTHRKEAVCRDARLPSRQQAALHAVRGAAGADPAAVVVDAADSALSKKADVLLVDTAGRLHVDAGLMRQLVKIREVLERKIPGAPHEVLLVLDATSGQNALAPAKSFGEAVGVTGIFLAKLDGTARGGIVVAIRDSLNVPVKLIGVGERPEDVQPFDPDAFIDEMFGVESAVDRST